MLPLDEQKVRWYWYMFEFECVMTWYTTHYDTITIAHSPAMQTHYNGNDIRLCADAWLNIWNGIVLVLNEQKVRWYWCIFEFECAITWCKMRYDTITIAHSPTI